MLLQTETDYHLSVQNACLLIEILLHLALKYCAASVQTRRGVSLQC